MRISGQPSSDRYPHVEFKDIRGRKIPGFLSIRELAAILGCNGLTLTKYVRQDLIRPDFYNRAAVFFDIARLEEIKKTWQNRSMASPVSAPAKGVITRFGMMLPRAKPDADLLRRLTLSRPKRPSRDSSWKTRRRYNLKDLTP